MIPDPIDDGRVVEVIEDEITDVYERTGVFVARTRTETWPSPRRARRRDRRPRI